MRERYADLRSYFGAALGAAGAGSFVLQSVTTEQTTDLDPSKFGFVVLSDAGTLPSIFEHTLSQYVAKGGGVLIALGTNAGQQARAFRSGELMSGKCMTTHVSEAPPPSVRWTSLILRSLRSSLDVITEVGRRQSFSMPHR